MKTHAYQGRQGAPWGDHPLLPNTTALLHTLENTHAAFRLIVRQTHFCQPETGSPHDFCQPVSKHLRRFGVAELLICP